jgi:hypothetical protein
VVAEMPYSPPPPTGGLKRVVGYRVSIAANSAVNFQPPAGEYWRLKFLVSTKPDNTILYLYDGANSQQFKSLTVGPPDFTGVLAGDIVYWTYATATDRGFLVSLWLNNNNYLRLGNIYSSAITVWLLFEVY